MWEQWTLALNYLLNDVTAMKSGGTIMVNGDWLVDISSMTISNPLLILSNNWMFCGSEFYTLIRHCNCHRINPSLLWECPYINKHGRRICSEKAVMVQWLKSTNSGSGDSLFKTMFNTWRAWSKSIYLNPSAILIPTCTHMQACKKRKGQDASLPYLLPADFLCLLDRD